MSDSPDSPPEPPDGSVADNKSKFTKEPQPELPLALRKEKAGWNWNRFLIWVVVGCGACYRIITGIVGILAKAR